MIASNGTLNENFRTESISVQIDIYLGALNSYWTQSYLF